MAQVSFKKFNPKTDNLAFDPSKSKNQSLSKIALFGSRPCNSRGVILCNDLDVNFTSDSAFLRELEIILRFEEIEILYDEFLPSVFSVFV